MKRRIYSVTLVENTSTWELAFAIMSFPTQCHLYQHPLQRNPSVPVVDSVEHYSDKRQVTSKISFLIFILVNETANCGRGNPQGPRCLSTSVRWAPGVPAPRRRADPAAVPRRRPFQRKFRPRCLLFSAAEGPLGRQRDSRCAQAQHAAAYPMGTKAQRTGTVPAPSQLVSPNKPCFPSK